jgi:hypothetical protein
MTTASRTGRFCTSAPESADLFQRIYDPMSGALQLDKSGPFWDAVTVTRANGQRGKGRRVLILDSAFDVTVEPLRGVVAHESTTETGTIARRGHHGTNVALLVHEVAPDAELVLVEIAPGAQPRSDAVASALGRAGHDVAVVNLSLEFSSDCPPRDLSPIDIDVVTSGDPPRVAFLDQVAVWLTLTDPYEPGGCSRPCELCEALRHVPSDTLVVAAAGNTDRPVCPACATRALGIGFEHQALVTREGGHVLSRSLPEGFVQNLLTELTVPQPNQLLGTSFAAPLVAGFAAVVEDRENFASMARLPFAMTPLLTLLGVLRRGRPEPSDATETLRQGFLAFLAGVPAPHRHWEQAEPRPCATCALFMAEWYKGLVSLLVGIGFADAAAPWARLAATLMPCSADVMALYGTTLVRLAAAAPAGSSESRRLTADAAEMYVRALELRPGDPLWEARLADLRS